MTDNPKEKDPYLTEKELKEPKLYHKVKENRCYLLY
jgi:hypothetical protein